MFRFFQFVCYLPIKTFFPSKVYGKKNLPKGGCIIASNHTSNLDAIMLALNTWEKKRYLAKKELFKGVISSGFFKGIGCIKIDRSKSDVSAIKTCLKILKEGKKLVIFPEGTRVNNENMQLGEVKHGVSMFACKAKVPIVPMFVSRKPKLFKRTKIYLGQPFELNEFYDKKLSQEELDMASQIVEDKMNELRENVLKSLTKK